jgi:hypothetical protein
MRNVCWVHEGAGVKNICRMEVSCRPMLSGVTVHGIDSGAIVIDDPTLRLPVDSRRGGGCLPTSSELLADRAPPEASSESSFSRLVDEPLFRFPRLMEPVRLDFGVDFARIAELSRTGRGESCMLNRYTESADQDPTNSFGLASENLQAVICTVRREVGGFPSGEKRRTHCGERDTLGAHLGQCLWIPRHISPFVLHISSNHTTIVKKCMRMRTSENEIHRVRFGHA